MYLSKLTPLLNKVFKAKYELFFLLAIILVAAVLRFYQLGKWSFWVDELFTLQNAIDWPANLKYNIGFALREHPITSGLIYTAVSQTEINEFNVRLMPAIVGVLSIPIFHWQVKKLYGISVALLFSLFLALSPWHIYWSQNTRFYIIMLLFYWIALFCFYEAYRNKWVWAYGISFFFIVLAVSERLLGLFIIPVIGLFIGLNLILDKKRKSNWLLILLTAIVGLLTSLIFGLEFIKDPQLWFEIYGVPMAISPLRLLVRHLQGIDLHIVVLAWVGGYFLFKEKRDDLILWSCSIVAPLIITIGFAFFQFTHPRYTFITLVGWLILAAIGADGILKALYRSVENWGVLTAVILLITLFPIVEIKEYHSTNHGGRLEWREAFQFVQSNANLEDKIFTNDDTVGQYYLNKHIPISMRSITGSAEQLMMCQLESPAWFIMGGDGRADYTLLTWVEEHATRLNYDADRIRIFKITPENCS